MQNREELRQKKKKKPRWTSKNDVSQEGEKYHFQEGENKYNFRTEK